MEPKLFKNQQEVKDLAIEKNTLIIHDCGSGKSLSALSVINHHLKNGLGPALVVAPKNLLIEAWDADRKTFYPNMDLVLLNGTPEKRRKLLYEDHEVFVITPGCFKADFPLVQDRNFDMLFVDESSMMKDVKSQNTKALLTLAGFQFRGKAGIKFDGGRRIPIRHCLSASPSPNSPSEFWSQVQMCTGPEGKVFNNNFYTFQDRYFTKICVNTKKERESPFFNEYRDGKFKYVFKSALFEEFCYKLASVSHVFRKEDSTDFKLPRQIHQIHRVPLGKAERQVYDKMSAELVVEVNNQTIKAVNVLSEMMKLRQLTSGFIYDEQGGTQRIGGTKFEYLKELIRLDSGTQKIVFINFREEADQMRGLPNFEVIDGQSKKTSEILAAFRRGDVQHIAANQMSLSHGVTAVNCHSMIYYSMNHSFELAKQSRDRIHRIGQVQDCFYDYIHADNTMDGVIHKATILKESMVNSFLATLVDIQNGNKPDFSGCDQVFRQSYSDILKTIAIAHIRGV